MKKNIKKGSVISFNEDSRPWPWSYTLAEHGYYISEFTYYNVVVTDIFYRSKWQIFKFEMLRLTTLLVSVCACTHIKCNESAE